METDTCVNSNNHEREHGVDDPDSLADLPRPLVSRNTLGNRRRAQLTMMYSLMT